MADKFFIRPNRSASLVQFWISDFIGSGGLLRSLFGFFQNACDLMLPQLFQWSTVLSYICGGAILIALFRALAARLRGEKQGRIVLVVTTLPVITAVVASYFREYPLLIKPRMIIWLLPICGLLLVYAIEPLWSWFRAKAGIRASALLTAAVAVLVCLVAVGLSFFVVERGRSNPLDDFRSGVLYLSRHAGPHDRVLLSAPSLASRVSFRRRHELGLLSPRRAASPRGRSQKAGAREGCAFVHAKCDWNHFLVPATKWDSPRVDRRACTVRVQCCGLPGCRYVEVREYCAARI